MMNSVPVDENVIRVLLVDDSPEDREFYRRFLQRDNTHNYEIKECGSLEDGFEECSANPPDCVILDYNLPDGEGVELLEDLADERGEVHIPVIVLTGQGSEEVAVKVMKKGAMDYLIKGEITSDSLCGTIAKVVEKNRMIETIRRQQVENEESLSLLQATLESTDNGIFVVDIEGKIIKTNTRFVEMWGFASDIASSTESGKILDGILAQLEDAEFFQSKIQKIQMNLNAESFDTLHLKDGQIFECFSKPMFIEAESKGRVWSFRDITERKRMEEKIRASEEGLRTIFETMTDGLVIVDMDGRIRQTNSAACRFGGYEKEDLIGVDSLEFVVDEDRERLTNDMANAMATGTASSESLIYKLKKKDIGWYHCEMSTSVLTDGAGNQIGFIAVERDVTDRLRMEKQLKDQTAMLIQSEKMSSLGVMVAGVAHELNNPMTGIVQYTQFCLRRTDEEDRRYAVLKDLEQEARRCSSIVRNMLTFTRMDVQGEEQYQKDNIPALIDRVLQLLAYRIRSEYITIVQHYNADMQPIPIKRNSIQQVFLNLIGNAIDAVHEKEEKEIRIEGWNNNGFVEVNVSDKGPGIPPDAMHKIFDPFFTTKQVGKGMGMGLSVSQSICKQHGGDIECESKMGEGTTFKVKLPVEPNNINKETV